MVESKLGKYEIPQEERKSREKLTFYLLNNDIQLIRLRSTDPYGRWHEKTYTTQFLANGGTPGLDGSSMRVWQGIDASDMLLIPNWDTTRIDPFSHPEIKSAFIICDIADPRTGEPYSRDPRTLAKKTEQFLLDSGIGDKAYFGPEAEFFMLDEVYVDEKGEIVIKSREGIQKGIIGHYVSKKEGYFPTPPIDRTQHVRDEIMVTLMGLGITVEAGHHEVASQGQAEINNKYNTLTEASDELMIYKHVVKMIAQKHGLLATFMPKVVEDDNGSGMHVHQSIWQGEEPLFAGDKYAGLSQTALHYVGGIFNHAAAICFLTNPTTNSYRRLKPGFEAPVNLVLSASNRSAGVRVPEYESSPKSKRVEVRFPDPSANPYLAFSAMLLAGIDGIKRNIEPGEPIAGDLYKLAKHKDPRIENIRSLPESLDEVIGAVRRDREFLTRVMPGDFIDGMIDGDGETYGKLIELERVKKAPNPRTEEFRLYFNC